MKTFTAIVIGLISVEITGATVKEIDALAHVESLNNAKAIGDHGKAKGRFQLWESVWLDISNTRLDRGLPIWEYKHVTNTAVANLYAGNLIDDLRLRLTSQLHRQPTAEEIYAAFNLGWNGFRQRHFELKRCPKRTRLVAKRYAVLLNR